MGHCPFALPKKKTFIQTHRPNKGLVYRRTVLVPSLSTVLTRSRSAISPADNYSPLCPLKYSLKNTFVKQDPNPLVVPAISGKTGRSEIAAEPRLPDSRSEGKLVPTIPHHPCLSFGDSISTYSRDVRMGCGWWLVFPFYPGFLREAILHPGNGSAHYRGNKYITTPNCCHRVGYFCNYGLCDARSIRADFCRRNHDRISRTPMEIFSVLGFYNLLFSFVFHHQFDELVKVVVLDQEQSLASLPSTNLSPLLHHHQERKGVYCFLTAAILDRIHFSREITGKMTIAARKVRPRSPTVSGTVLNTFCKTGR